MKSILALLSALGLTAMMLVLSCGDDDTTNPSKPDRITPVSGLYYHGTMGTSTLDKPLLFRLTDKSDNAYANRWLHFAIVAGDGTLSADSVKTDASGQAVVWYTFDGALGHAVLRVSYPGITSVDVYLRASTIIPSATGQGQYVLFADTYKNVKDFNGLPASVDVDPSYYINYANYQTAKGVVVILEDIDEDEVADDADSVFGVILTTIYEGKTADSIGIGSTLAQVRAAYGTPDTVRYDPSPPPAIAIRYLALGMTLYGERNTDTTIFEIHVTEDITDLTPGKAAAREGRASASSVRTSHRLFRR